MKRSKLSFYGVLLLLIGLTVITLLYRRDVIKIVLQRRLSMGHPVKNKLHTKDTLFKHAAVAADNPTCSEFGKDAFKDGGSAVDAAIVTMLCLGVINSHSTGIGGGGYMLIYSKKKKKGEVIDFREAAPEKAHPDLFHNDPEKGIRGGLAVGVPGELRGIELAWKKYGKLEWMRLFAPSIKLAKEGFPIPQTLDIATHKWINDTLHEKCLKALYTSNGKLLKTGDTLKNPELAQTLQIIANAGNANPFYEGAMSGIIVDEVKKKGGILTLKDLKSYRAISKEPLKSKLGAYTVLNTPPTASGPVLALIFNILKGYQMCPADLKDNPALVYHRIIEAFKFAYARRTLLADSTVEYKVDDVLEEMMNEKTAKEIRKKISDTKTFPPEYYGGKYDVPVTTGTTHLVVVAPNGDAVTVMDTVNGYLGAKFRSCKLGFIYNNEMDDFSAPGMPNEFGLPPSPINFIKPKKRPQSSGVPVVILDENMDVRLVAGGSGGSIITTAVAQVIMNHLWFDMSLKDSVQAARFHSQLIPDKVFVESRFSDKIIKKLKKFGHKIEKGDESHAVVQAIARDSGQWAHHCYKKERIHKKRPKLYAESDFRKGGKPAGY